MREKLIELYRKAHKETHEHCNNIRCDQCKYEHLGSNCIKIAKADNLIDNGVTIQKWIPVTERLPEKAADYLCRCTVNDFDDMPFYMVLRYIVYDKNPHFQHETKGGMKVTHWMPLPEPPKEVE